MIRREGNNAVSLVLSGLGVSSQYENGCLGPEIESLHNYRGHWASGNGSVNAPEVEITSSQCR
jgi:hypothetical protein